MKTNSEFMHRHLNSFLTHTNNSMTDQALYVATGIHMLSLDIQDGLISPQQQGLTDLMITSRYLKEELINQTLIFNTAFKFIYRPEDYTYDEVDVNNCIKSAIKNAVSFEDVTDFVIVNEPDEKLVIQTTSGLLVRGISNLIMWLYHLTISTSLLIDLSQTQSDIILVLTGKFSSKEAELKNTTKNFCYFFKSSAEFIISILGGSFSWNIDEIIPTNNEAIIYLPKKIDLSSD